MAEDTPQQPETPPAAAEDGFGAAFAERTANPAGRAPEADATSETQEAPEGEKPSGEPGSGDQPDTQARSPEPAEQPSGPRDPWTGLTPEQETYFKKLQLSERRQRASVGGLTKKLNGLTASTAPPQTPQRPQGDDGAPKADAKDAFKTKMEAAATEYPDVVGPFKEVIDNLREEIAAIKVTTAKVETQSDAAETMAAYATLETEHPDFREIAEDASFSGWVKDQSPDVQRLANSWNPREVSLSLALFKAERAAAFSQLATQAAPTGENGGQHDATATRRQRQLDGSMAVTSRGAPATGGVPNDFKSAFRARSEQYAREGAR